MDEKDALLGRMKTALEAGRDRRKDELARTGEDIREELSSYKGKGALEHESRIAPMLDAASKRGFLSHIDIEDRYGKETRVEVAEAKVSEKYDKRPSVRALRRRNGRKIYPSM